MFIEHVSAQPSQFQTGGWCGWISSCDHPGKSVHGPQMWPVGAMQVLLNPSTLPVLLEDCIHFFPAQTESVGRVWWCSDCHSLPNPLGSLANRRCLKTCAAGPVERRQSALTCSFSKIETSHANHVCTVCLCFCYMHKICKHWLTHSQVSGLFHPLPLRLHTE